MISTTLNKFTLLCLVFFLTSCAKKHENQIDGHWHNAHVHDPLFHTIDIEDSIIIANKYAIGSFDRYIDVEDVKFQQIDENQLIIFYIDTTLIFYKSELKKCLFEDRYKKCMIELSLPEEISGHSYDSINHQYHSGNLFIGKIKQGISLENDQLSNNFPDSIFIQANDVFIGEKDIPNYIIDLKDALHVPKANINIHADKYVPVEKIQSIAGMIKNMNTEVHYIVKTKGSWDISVLK